MRFKATFLVGFAAGYVVGARAGRERYEQMVQAGRKVAGNPTVQKATSAASARANELTKVAKDKAAERMPKLTETAKTSATRMRGQLDRLPGRHAAQPGAVADTGAGPGPGTETEPATVNGIRPVE